MAHVRWTNEASEALSALVLDRRQQVGFNAARALLQRIRGRVYLLREFPELGRRRAENDEGRELIVPPYIIPYQIVGDTVFILGIFHAQTLHPDNDDAEP